MRGVTGLMLATLFLRVYTNTYFYIYNIYYKDIWIYIYIYKLKPFPQHVGGGHVMEVTITHTFTKTPAHSQHFNQLGSNTAIEFDWRLCMANTKHTSGSSVEGPGSFHWFTPSASFVQQADPTCTASVIPSLAVQVGRTLHWSRQFMHSQSLSIHSSL